MTYSGYNDGFEAGYKRALQEVKKNLPKELGFDDYDKHMHTYIFENRGNCGICGLSWKKATQYEIYNNAIIQMKKILNKMGKVIPFN